MAKISSYFCYITFF